MGQINEIVYKIIQGIDQIDERQWNRCANPTIAQNGKPDNYDPFLSYSFLHALEASKSAVRETGWLPHHLIAVNKDNHLLGAIPLYLKQHSRGEYVFDFGWADAFERAGGAYYPKLQASIPFTPVTGKRILVPPDENQKTITGGLLDQAIALLNKYQLSSLHFTFLDKSTWDELGNKGFLKRIDQQFHWKNEGYESFEAFLKTLSSKKRRNIQRERKQALQSGILIEHLTGNDIAESHWDVFFQFYQNTGDRKWGNPYLTREFFSLVGASMADRILLIMCKRDGKYIAGALNFIGGDTLFGRYWGCLEMHPSLHFEVCYYQAIDYAIANKLGFVEAGAQGEHKLARGYLPTYTYSAHWIAHPAFREAIEHYLDSEMLHVKDENRFLNQHSPYRCE